MTASHPVQSAEHQYLGGQMRASFGPLLADFERRNALALALPGWELDQAYGTHPREVFDLLPAGPGGLGTLLFFHAGYWQSRDKAQFRFLAPLWQALGWHTALVNYPLCPEVSVARIVSSAWQALHRVAERQASCGRRGPLALCGHSAGAHLVVELALARHAHALALPVAGVLPVSGIFDLQPLVATTLNQRLRLDAAQARACSPLYRAQAGCVPAVFMVGETETTAFHEQSQAMAGTWRAQGNAAHCEILPGADHFSALQQLGEPQGALARSLRAWTSGNLV
jgi:arylformamidase